jgi:hypothetical protein
MSDGSGWQYLVGLGVLMILAGLEVRSGKGLLWKRQQKGPLHAGLGVTLIVVGILFVGFGAVLHFSPR